MATLMERLRTNQQSAAANVAAGPAASVPQLTSKLTDVLAAKRGQSSSQPVGENLLESAQVQDTKDQGRQLAQQTQLDTQSQATAERGQQVQATQAGQAANLADQGQAQKFKQQADNIATELSQGRRSLDVAKDRAGVEAAVASARLSNDKYTTRLAQEGDKRRLDAGYTFEQEMLKSNLGEAQKLLEYQIGQDILYNASQMDFEKALSNLDLDSWLKASQYAAQSAGAAQVATGVGTAVEGGTKAWANSKDNRPATAPSTQSTGPTAGKE